MLRRRGALCQGARARGWDVLAGQRVDAHYVCDVSCRVAAQAGTKEVAYGTAEMAQDVKHGAKASEILKRGPLLIPPGLFFGCASELPAR
jgi:hypothetical protein